MKTAATRLGILVVAALALEAAIYLELVNPRTLPPPHVVLAVLGQHLRSGVVFPHVAATMSRLGIAFALAMAIGFPLGLLLWRLPRAGRAFEPVLASLYGLPWILLYPILLVFLGVGRGPIVFLGALYGLIPIALNSYVGFSSVKPSLLKLAKVSGFRSYQRVSKIMVPSAIPHLVTGLKLGFVYCFVLVIATELLVSSSGLGHIITFAYDHFRLDEMYAHITLVVAIAFMISLVLDRIELRVRGRFQ